MKNQYVEALPAFNEALLYIRNEKQIKCELYKYLGKTYYALERYEEAIEAFNESMKLCEEIEQRSKEDDNNNNNNTDIKSDLTLSLGKTFFKTV